MRGGDGQRLLVKLFGPPALDAAVIDDQRHVRIFDGHVAHPKRMKGLRPVVVAERISHHDTGMDLRHRLVLAHDVHDDSHLVHALGVADGLAARAVGGHAFADADELAGGQQLVELLGRGFGRPGLLAVDRLFRRFHRRAGGHKFVGVALDQLHIELVAHAERRQEHAHVDVVAFHVVEEARRVVVGLEPADRLGEVVVARAVRRDAVLLERCACGEPLRVHVGVDDKAPHFHDGDPPWYLAKPAQDGSESLRNLIRSIPEGRRCAP